MTPTSSAKYILCKSLVSDSLLERITFVRQCLSVTSLIFCVTGFVSAKKQTVSIDLWKTFFVRPSNKIVGLNLAPFSEMVVNHCCRSKKNVPTAASYFLVRMIKPGLQ